MKAVFADTFYWVGLTDPGDALYTQAAGLDASLTGTPTVTTDEVLSEFLTFFSGDPWLRTRAVDAVRILIADPGVPAAEPRILQRRLRAFCRSPRQAL